MSRKVVDPFYTIGVGTEAWRPIDTAPKDGTRVLGYGTMALERDLSAATVKWCTVVGEWQCDPSEATEYGPERCALTHWMRLPEPPGSIRRDAHEDERGFHHVSPDGERLESRRDGGR